VTSGGGGGIAKCRAGSLLLRAIGASFRRPGPGPGSFCRRQGGRCNQNYGRGKVSSRGRGAPHGRNSGVSRPRGVLRPTISAARYRALPKIMYATRSKPMPIIATVTSTP
jgi:hypothetical protein